MKKFCSRCGRLIEVGETCVCRKNVKRQYKKIPFYESQAWRKLSSYVKIRDFMLDRLQMYFCKYKPANDIEKMVYGYVVDALGQPRKFSGALIAHHIVPREDNYSLQFVTDNLITVNYHVHEYIHMLYGQGKKEAVQELLRKCVHATLP